MVLMRDDEAWLAQARAGNPDAFIAIVDRYERRIYGFAYHMTGDAAAAAELTRESACRRRRTGGDANGGMLRPGVGGGHRGRV